jgi:hypothetical protein
VNGVFRLLSLLNVKPKKIDSANSLFFSINRSVLFRKFPQAIGCLSLLFDAFSIVCAFSIARCSFRSIDFVRFRSKKFAKTTGRACVRHRLEVGRFLESNVIDHRNLPLAYDSSKLRFIYSLRIDLGNNSSVPDSNSDSG